MIVVSPLKVLMPRRTKSYWDSPLPAEQLMNVFPAAPLSWPPLLAFDGAIGVGVAVAVAVAVAVGVAVVVGVGVAVAVAVFVAVAVVVTVAVIVGVAVAVAVVVAVAVAVRVAVAVAVSVGVGVAVAVPVGVAGYDPTADPASLTVTGDFPFVALLVMVIVAPNSPLLIGEN